MKKIIAFICFLLLTSIAFAQKVSYRMSFPNAIHHEATIRLTVSGIANKPAIFKMSRSSPGRYATHEFGKNIYDVTAADANGKELKISRIDGDIYEVNQHNGTITISYTLFANHADGTYAGIDPESIHLNMPACFMWMKGLEEAPIEIDFSLPKENKGVIATQLYPTNNPLHYTAPNLQYFMDSPTKIGDLTLHTWKEGDAMFRIALEADATDEQATELTEKVKKIVRAAKAVFGEFPKYEPGYYTFITSANPYVQGDGMEHRNSTMITIPMRNFRADGLLGVTSHEFFHNWNAERIRPKTLEPFNFEKSNMSHELWFVEGFTQYYGELLLSRAGLVDAKEYIETIAGLINSKAATPGAQFYSPIQASNHAVFVDASVSIDKNNYPNMFTSYYVYGGAIALALDLELQFRFNRTLDDYMKAMWQDFGKKEKPYSVEGMQTSLTRITNAEFASDFFTRYIYGHEPIDYKKLLAFAGYDVTPASQKPTMGVNTRVSEGKVVIARNTVRGTAAYEAGLDLNDEILMLDGAAVNSNEELTRLVEAKKVGDNIEVTYRHRGKERKTSLHLTPSSRIILTAYEASEKSVTESIKKIRSTWFTHIAD